VTTTGDGDAHDTFVIEKGTGMRHMTTTKWWRHVCRTYISRTHKEKVVARYIYMYIKT